MKTLLMLTLTFAVAGPVILAAQPADARDPRPALRAPALQELSAAAKRTAKKRLPFCNQFKGAEWWGPYHVRYNSWRWHGRAGSNMGCA